MAALAALTPIVDMLFPPRCPLCGDPLAAQGGLCVACWSELAVPGEPACGLCQRPLGAEHEGEVGLVCVPCLARPPRHEGIAAATLYNDASRQLVLAFKHGRRTALGKLLARLIVPKIPALDGQWLVVPVPLHRWRLWHRGFNQAAILADQVGKAIGQPVVPDALIRQRRTPPLGPLDRRKRAAALAGAIGANPHALARLKGASVLLVDDVMTSGATTDSCLKALRKAGVKRVRIACFARVLDEALEHAEQGMDNASQKETPGR